MTRTSPSSATSSTTGNPAITKNSALPGDLGPTAEISLSTVQNNYLALKSHSHGAETAGVVKADCYGHGVQKIAPALMEVGCSTFFVAYLREGVALRQTLGPEPRIFIFNGLQPDDLPELTAANLTPICNTVEEVSAALAANLPAGYALHVDTGMNRLGIRPEDVATIASQTAAQPPCILMSHLACADQPDHPLNALQLARFKAAREHFPNVPASLSATGGIYLGADYTFDLVRPGIGLYGGGPARPMGLKLKTAMTLTAPVLNVFDLEPEASIGYGASYAPKTPAVIATVALGYADGFLRSGGNFGFAVIDGMPCPIVGRISMDLITLDVTDLPERPAIGDRAEFIGKMAGYEIQAEALGTIGYELTSRIGGRVLKSWI